MADLNDPRVFFAAERTLLAWVRTGLAVMGLGFVEARFGLFLRMIHQGQSTPHAGSTWLGVGLILFGILATLAAGVQHLRFCRTLGSNELPRQYTPLLGLMLAFAVAGAGAVVAIHLVLELNAA